MAAPANAQQQNILAWQNIGTFVTHNHPNVTDAPSIYQLQITATGELISNRSCAFIRVIQLICTYIADLFRSLPFIRCCQCVQQTLADRQANQNRIREALTFAAAAITTSLEDPNLEITGEHRQWIQLYNQIINRLPHANGCIHSLQSRAGWTVGAMPNITIPEHSYNDDHSDGQLGDPVDPETLAAIEALENGGGGHLPPPHDELDAATRAAIEAAQRDNPPNNHHRRADMANEVHNFFGAPPPPGDGLTDEERRFIAASDAAEYEATHGVRPPDPPQQNALLGSNPDVLRANGLDQTEMDTLEAIHRSTLDQPPLSEEEQLRLALQQSEGEALANPSSGPSESAELEEALRLSTPPAPPAPYQGPIENLMHHFNVYNTLINGFQDTEEYRAFTAVQSEVCDKFAKDLKQQMVAFDARLLRLRAAPAPSRFLNWQEIQEIRTQIKQTILTPWMSACYQSTQTPPYNSPELLLPSSPVQLTRPFYQYLQSLQERLHSRLVEDLLPYAFNNDQTREEAAGQFIAILEEMLQNEENNLVALAHRTQQLRTALEILDTNDEDTLSLTNRAAALLHTLETLGINDEDTLTVERQKIAALQTMLNALDSNDEDTLSLINRAAALLHTLETLGINDEDTLTAARQKITELQTMLNTLGTNDEDTVKVELRKTTEDLLKKECRKIAEDILKAECRKIASSYLIVLPSKVEETSQPASSS
jgi:hypothetical protein